VLVAAARLLDALGVPAGAGEGPVRTAADALLAARDEGWREGRLVGVREAERLAALRAEHEAARHEQAVRAAYAAGRASGAGAAP
jgi:hypothetical protein